MIGRETRVVFLRDGQSKTNDHFNPIKRLTLGCPVTAQFFPEAFLRALSNSQRAIQKRWQYSFELTAITVQ